MGLAGRRGVTADGYGVFFWGAGNVLELIEPVVAQQSEGTKHP